MFADKGTQYFHYLVKKRNSSFTIAALIKSNGSITTSQNEVAMEFVNSFDALLGYESHFTPISTYVINEGHVLSVEDVAYLTTPITDLDIK